MLDDPRCVTTTRIMRHYMRITIIITTATTSRTVKTTPTLATVMNFIIAFSLPLPRSPVSVSSISARAQYTRTSSPAQHKRNARHCAVAVALTASVQLTRSFPFSVISEDGNGVTENQGGRRQRGTSVNARNAAVRPSYCVRDSNYSIVIAFATLTHLISRDHALLFGRVQQLYASTAQTLSSSFQSLSRPKNARYFYLFRPRPRPRPRSRSTASLSLFYLYPFAFFRSDQFEYVIFIDLN